MAFILSSTQQKSGTRTIITKFMSLNGPRYATVYSGGFSFNGGRALFFAGTSGGTDSIATVKFDAFPMCENASYSSQWGSSGSYSVAMIGTVLPTAGATTCSTAASTYTCEADNGTLDCTSGECSWNYGVSLEFKCGKVRASPSGSSYKTTDRSHWNGLAGSDNLCTKQVESGKTETVDNGCNTYETTEIIGYTTKPLWFAEVSTATSTATGTTGIGGFG